MKTTILTLALPIADDQTLLGLKKGLGAGYWNGFGGKVEGGEGIETAARRELEEEIGLVATTIAHSGIVKVTYLDTQELPAGLHLDHVKISSAVEMHIFRVNAWKNSPSESGEMAPRWFSATDIPYDRMWPDDRHWLPLVLANKRFKMHCVFKNKHTMLSYTIRELQSQHV